jgi:PAS domain S-box-containing protein
VDMEGKITELSPAVKDFSNYKREELIGKDVALLYKHGADRETFLNAIKQKGVVKDHVIELADKDGSPKNISVNATLVRDGNGQPEKIVGIIRDVTEIEKKNNDLRWLRRAIEHSPVSIVITDVHGKIEYTNPTFTKTTNYTKEEAYKQNPSMLKSGKQSASFYKEMWDTILNGDVWEGEFQNKRKDGSLFIERAIISPVKDDEGKIVNFIAIKEDITASKMALEEIKHLKTFNDRIINTMHEGIVVESAEGEILFTNPSFAALTGYPMSKLIGHRWDKVIDKKSRMDMLNENDWQSDVLNVSIESELKCQNGELVPVLMSSSPIQDGRKYMGLISVFTDITQIKENEKKLTEALEKAQLSDRLKSSFLANVSHEIRTPMNAILGFSEILRNEKNLDEAVRDEYFSIIELKGTELLQVISDVIDISKIEAKMMPLSATEIAINPFLEKIFLSFKESLQLHGIHAVTALKIVPPDSGLAIIKVDAVRLNQVFLNLLHNARKFTSYGEISIGYSIYGTYVEFFVKDTGIGISPENQKIIFDRFRQVEEGYTHVYGGTGLGLNICKNLMELMGGNIRVESEINKGSTFFLSLPR